MFQNLKNKFNALCTRSYVAVQNFVEEQDGDTNFISIMIILGVVVVFAGLFKTLGGDIIDKVGDKIEAFLNSLG